MRMSKKKEIVPKLRFPEFSKSYWGITRLNALADKIAERNKGDDISRVFTNSATEGVVDQEEYFDRDIANKNNLTNYFVVEKGDYVYNPRISTTAPVGPISKNKLGIGLMSPLYTVFRFRNKENDFYEHFFLTNLWHSYIILEFRHTGARHDRITISVDNFMKMPLPYTSPDEEQKIADCLSSIDELIDAESRKLKALEKYKKGLMQKLFPAEGKTLPEWRFPEFRHKNEWRIKPLGKICTNYDSRRIPITEKDRVRGEIPYIGASGVIGYINDFIFDEDLLCVSEDGANLVARTYPIAFSISGKTWVNNHAHVLKFFHKYTQDIVESYLNMINLQDFLTGMAQPKLNRAKLDIIPIPLPEEEEQQKIADCLSEIDTMIKEQSNKVEQLKAHKKGLMQGLFPSLEEADV
jgi:type I restriction enzyme S subunit